MFIGFVLAVAGALGIVSLVKHDPSPMAGSKPLEHAGGLAGALVAHPLAVVAQPIGAAIVCAGFAFLGLLVFTGTPLSAVGHGLRALFFGEREEDEEEEEYEEYEDEEDEEIEPERVIRLEDDPAPELPEPFEEDDVSGLGGDIGATRHGDADVGFAQGQAVVHSVAHHGHDATLELELADQVRLVLRKHFRVVMTQSERLGDEATGDGVVTGEQDHIAHLACPERLNRFVGVGAELVLQDEHGREPTRDGHEDRGGARGVGRRLVIGRGAQIDAAGLHEAPTAHQHILVVHADLDAVADTVRKALR